MGRERERVGEQREGGGGEREEGLTWRCESIRREAGEMPGGVGPPTYHHWSVLGLAAVARERWGAGERLEGDEH